LHLVNEIKWQLPKGISAGAIQWPVPEKLEEKVDTESIVTYIYTETVVFLVPLKLATDLPNGTLDLNADLSWIECKEQCSPGSAKVQAKLNIGAATKPSGDATLIDVIDAFYVRDDLGRKVTAPGAVETELRARLDHRALHRARRGRRHERADRRRRARHPRRPRRAQP
jgi:thiol:disulfide interchange protein DsbD